MTNPVVIEQALEHLSHHPGALILVRAQNREQARITLSRMGDRARALALNVELRFGYRQIRRADGRGFIRVCAEDEVAMLDRVAGGRPPWDLELDASGGA